MLSNTGVREDGDTMVVDSVRRRRRTEVLVWSSCLQLEAHAHFVPAAVEVLPVNQS